jgi:thiamine phosphate synthase YjbQ (UPF0047 family)
MNKDENQTVEIENVEVTVTPPSGNRASDMLRDRDFQRLFDDIRDEVVRILHGYGIPDAHLSRLSAHLTKEMLHIVVRQGRLK